MLFTRGAVVTVRGCVRSLERAFRAAQVEEASCSAQYIVAAALGQKTLHRINNKTRINDETLSKIESLAKQRLSHTPVQYVVGDWDFRSLCLAMRAPVLIPRPETEELVQHILDSVSPENKARFLEIGCGSGAISLSLLQENPQLQGEAIDISEVACTLTELNARNNDLDTRLKVMHQSFTDFCRIASERDEKYDFIVSNPPYISTVDMEKLHPQVKLFEDERALHGGEDGLDLIRDILDLSPQLLKNGEFQGQGSLWLEVDSSHPPLIAEYVQKHVPSLTYTQTIKDFCGKQRFCQITLKKS